SELTGAECKVDADCAGTVTPCQSPACKAGLCIVQYPIDNAVPSQLVSDCKVNVCNGTGSVIGVTDTTDVYVDNNPCTDDVCLSGKPKNPPNRGACPLDGA